MGGIGTAATTAPLLAASGAAHLLAPLLRAPTGSAQLHWSTPPPPPGPSGPALAAAGEPADARKEMG